MPALLKLQQIYNVGKVKNKDIIFLQALEATLAGFRVVKSAKGPAKSQQN